MPLQNTRLWSASGISLLFWVFPFNSGYIFFCLIVKNRFCLYYLVISLKRSIVATFAKTLCLSSFNTVPKLFWQILEFFNFFFYFSLFSSICCLFSCFLMLSSILRFHHGFDFVLPSILAFLSRICLETQTELATIRLFVSVILDVPKNLNTVFTHRLYFNF